MNFTSNVKRLKLLCFLMTCARGCVHMTVTNLQFSSTPNVSCHESRMHIRLQDDGRIGIWNGVAEEEVRSAHVAVLF